MSKNEDNEIKPIKEKASFSLEDWLANPHAGGELGKIFIRFKEWISNPNSGGELSRLGISFRNWALNSHSGGEFGRVFSGFKDNYSRLVNKQRFRELSRKADRILQNTVFTDLTKNLVLVLLTSFLVVFIELYINASTDGIIKIALNNIEAIAIVSGALVYILRTPDRKVRKIEQAWQSINASRGIKVSEERLRALEFLNNSGRNLRKIEIPNAQLDGINLEGARLSGANLSGVNFSNAKLSKANFFDANLANADFYEAEIHDARFNLADLRGANFTGASLEGSDLTATKLDKAVFWGTCLKNAKLLHLDFSLTNQEESKGPIKWKTQVSMLGMNFSHSNLTLANFSELTLYEADFTNCHLTGAKFCGTNLTGAKFNNVIFRHVDIHDAILDGTDLTDADLTDVKNYSVREISRAKLCRTKLPADIESQIAEQVYQGFKINPNRDCPT